jgi:tetraacyldisaccharide 4'-kinase
VGVFSGLAQPASLRRGVEALGAQVVAERRFGDHHRYRPGDVADLAARASVWITTEKDAIKIPAGWIGAADVRVLAIELAVDEPDRLLGWLDARLR